MAEFRELNRLWSGSMHMWILILIFVVLLFLGIILAAALSPTSVRSSNVIPARPLPGLSSVPSRVTLPGNGASAENLAAHAPINSPSTDVGMDYFRAVGQRSYESPDQLAITHEGFFKPANERFTSGGRNDSDSGICFLTGQAKAACLCLECTNRRGNRGH